MRWSAFAFCLFILSVSAPGARADDFDPTALIGLDPRSAFDLLGPPKEVFPFRNQDEQQDNVVFFYPDFFYLFWYRNRVWQVRCDMRFGKQVFGFSIGDSRKRVEAGVPALSDATAPRQFIPTGDSLYFTIDTGSYPLRVRLVFKDDILTDIYVYRSDF